MGGILSTVKAIIPDHVKMGIRAGRAIRDHNSTSHVWQHIDQELLDEARILSDVFELLDRMPKDAVAAEIGVAEGGLSREIVRRTRPRKLYLVDPWNSKNIAAYSEKSLRNIEKDLSSHISSGIVELRRGYSSDVLPGFEDDHLDWVYVDGAHDYAGVKQDLANCMRIVKPGGLIAGHDYVRWASPTDRYGVVEAVNEFVNRTRSRFLFLTNQFDKHDSFCIVLNK